MTLELLKSKGIEGELPYRGVYTVTVPGAWAGWAALHQRLDGSRWRRIWPRHLVRRARLSGDEVTAELWARSVQLLSEDPESRSTFLTGGRSPRAGETFRNRTRAVAPGNRGAGHRRVLQGPDGSGDRRPDARTRAA